MSLTELKTKQADLTALLAEISLQVKKAEQEEKILLHESLITEYNTSVIDLVPKINEQTKQLDELIQALFDLASMYHRSIEENYYHLRETRDKYDAEKSSVEILLLDLRKARCGLTRIKKHHEYI